MLDGLFKDTHAEYEISVSNFICGQISKTPNTVLNNFWIVTLHALGEQLKNSHASEILANLGRS